MIILRKYPFAPALIFLIFSFILFTLPGSSFPKTDWLGVPHLDKLVHIILFFILCLLFSFGVSVQAFRNSRKIVLFWIVAISGILYGTAIEFVQKYWFAYRSFDYLDMAADAIGAVLALIVSYLTLLKKHSSK
jgi:VanZ family protein